MTAYNAESYYVWRIGCQMNRADEGRVGSELERHGLRPAETLDAADVVVINSCVVRQQAENKVRGRLYEAAARKRERPDLVIALMGCLVGIDAAGQAELAAQFPFVDVFMPPSDVSPLAAFLADRAGSAACEPAGQETRRGACDAAGLLPPSQRGRCVTAHIPVVLGCSHGCSFCIIPARRGREHSRPLPEILADARDLASQGVREITLLGQIVDRYGVDLDDRRDLADLLRAVHDLDDIRRIRFLTSHPRWISDRLLDTVAALDRVCPHLEIPVQSGNDVVLRRMRRGYTGEQFRDLIHRIRRRIPDAAITTDVIVGFPGETDEQFADTVQLLRDVRFDKVHLAKYSPRPGTAAAERLPDDVGDQAKVARHRVLDALQREILETKHAAYLGRTVDVLVDGRQHGRWCGRTEKNKIVFFADDRDLLGRIVPVTVEWTGPFSLVGRAAASGPTAAHRRAPAPACVATAEVPGPASERPARLGARP